MAVREVSLYLKYPGSKDKIRRAQNSLLECVVEFKTGKEAVMLTTSPKELKSEYRIKGSVCLVEDELIVQFKPKNVGLYTIRIFSDTRELCLPVAILVDSHCEVEGTYYDRPVRPTAAYLRRSPALSVSAQQNRSSAFEERAVSPAETSPEADAWQQSPESMQQQQQPRPTFREVPDVHPEIFDSGLRMGRGFTSDPTLSPPDVHPSLSQPEYQGYSPGDSAGMPPMPTRDVPPGPANRMSYISGVGSRPPSMVGDMTHFSGDLHTTVPDKRSFDHLYSEKNSGALSYGARRDPLSFSHDTIVTPDVLKNIPLIGRKKSKKRCGICTKKLKSHKLVQMGEDDFCEACFKRQYLVRSAIEHFMIPTVEECTVEVPVNKKSTKFITTRKTIPNVNLRGLEASEVRYAQGEFKKFDIEGNGWISKTLLFPLMKSCFYYTLQDREIKSLLSSQALKSVITSYGLDKRNEVHEVEFLGLLAFVARERQRLKTRSNPHTKFTASDLEMAYAFRKQYQGMAGQQVHGSQAGYTGAQLHSPQHTSPTRSMSPQSQNTSPSHHYQMSPSASGQLPYGQQPRVRMAHAYQVPRNPMVKSPTESAMQSHAVQPPINLNASMVASPQVPTFSPTSIRRPTANLNPHQFSPYYAVPRLHPGMDDMRTGGMNQHSELQSYQAQRQRDLVTRRRDLTRNIGAFDQPDTNAVNANTGFELPEADRDDQQDLPHLPPDKDPQSQTLTRPQAKKKPDNKDMMEELKLTGGISDGWMMY